MLRPSVRLGVRDRPIGIRVHLASHEAETRARGNRSRRAHPRSPHCRVPRRSHNGHRILPASGWFLYAYANSSRCRPPQSERAGATSKDTSSLADATRTHRDRTVTATLLPRTHMQGRRAGSENKAPCFASHAGASTIAARSLRPRVRDFDPDHCGRGLGRKPLCHGFHYYPDRVPTGQRSPDEGGRRPERRRGHDRASRIARHDRRALGASSNRPGTRAGAERSRTSRRSSARMQQTAPSRSHATV